MNEMLFAVPTLFGLEGLAGDELRRMDLENVRVEDRRVLFTGDERALPAHSPSSGQAAPEPRPAGGAERPHLEAE